MSRVFAASLLSIFLLGGVVTGSDPSTTPSYTLTDLGPGTGNAIDDSGVVVGVLDYRATLWTLATGGATDLGIPDSVATGVNADGVVVGNSALGAFRWKDGVTTYLGSLPGCYTSEAAGVNASGHVVGTCYGYDEYYGTVYHAFLWEDGVMTDLGTLGGLSSAAAAINDSGTVVGWADLSDGWTRHAFAWDAVAGMSDLGAAPGRDVSAATSIDDSGRAAGWSYTTEWWCDYEYGCWPYPGPAAATLFADGAVIELAGPESRGYGIRGATADHGVQVVGTFMDYDYTTCGYAAPFLWEVDSAGQVTAKDLNDLLDAPRDGWLVGVSAVDAAGRIVASGHDALGAAHVFVLTPSTLPPLPHVLRAPVWYGVYADSESVHLYWSSVCDADSYVVQRGTTPGGPYETIATGLTQTSFTDTGAALGSTYYYVVAGVEGTSVGALSAEVATAPLPYPPTNLTAKAGKGKNRNQVVLAWTQSSSQGVAHYEVYGYDPYTYGVVKFATLGPASTYTVTGLARRTSYSFWVTAVHAGGQESPYSNVVTVVTAR